MTTAFLSTRATRRKAITFAILLALTLVLMAFSSNPAMVELQKAVTFAFTPARESLNDAASGVASFFRTIGEIDTLRRDNAALRAENDRLTNESVSFHEVRRENDMLTALLQLQAGFEHETVAATIVAREPAEFRRAVTIDRGTEQGVAVGDVVIAAGGALVGRVVEVGPNFANVTLLTDGTSIVIGQLGSTAATGEVLGQLGGALTMTKIDSSERIQLGEEVVTAGIELGGGIRSPYPKGLLVGQVIDVRRDANDVVQTAYLEPAAAFDRLEYVLVIVNYEGGLPAAEEQPVDCETQTEEEEGTLPEGEQPCFTPTESPR